MVQRISTRPELSLDVIVHLPSIKQMQYLVALRQHGHFGKAAEACYVTQSALSASLRELEALLGVTLVERTRRVVRFTALGHRVTDKAEKVLYEAEELAGMARAEGQPLHGELRLGVIPTIAPFLLPTLLPELRSRYPNLKLQIREETSQMACEALHRGQLDCVLLARPYSCGDIDYVELFDDWLFVAYAHGEAPVDPAIDVATIDAERLLLLEDGHCLKDHALSACNRPDLRSHAAAMGTSLHTLVQLVENGLGLTFVPALAIRAGILAGTDVIAKPLRSDHGFRRIALVWRRSSPREDEFQLLARILRHAAGELIPGLGATDPAEPPVSWPLAASG